MLLLAKTISKLSVFCGRKLAAGNTRINELCTRNICFSSLKSWGCFPTWGTAHIRDFCTREWEAGAWNGGRTDQPLQSLFCWVGYVTAGPAARVQRVYFPFLWAPQRCSDRSGEDPCMPPSCMWPLPREGGWLCSGCVRSRRAGGCLCLCADGALCCANYGGCMCVKVGEPFSGITGGMKSHGTKISRSSASKLFLKHLNSFSLMESLY